MIYQKYLHAHWGRVEISYKYRGTLRCLGGRIHRTEIYSKGILLIIVFMMFAFVEAVQLRLLFSHVCLSRSVLFDPGCFHRILPLDYPLPDRRDGKPALGVQPSNRAFAKTTCFGVRSDFWQ